ncbi:unnamed protein product [Cunninghamella blakesleeana]
MNTDVIEEQNIVKTNSNGTSTYNNEPVNQSQAINKDIVESMENMNINNDKKEQSSIDNTSSVNNSDNIINNSHIENMNNNDNENKHNNNEDNSNNNNNNNNNSNSNNNNSNSNNNIDDGSSVQSYYLKTIDWKDFDNGTSKIVRIILQNENGPCPLVSICNVLLIRGDIQIRPFERSTITFDYLVECLGDYLLNHAPNDEKLPNSNSLPKLSSSPSNLSDENLDQRHSSINKNNYKQSTMEYVLTYRHNLETAFTILPHLQTGLDVNVHFNSIREFEPTAELALFDLFNVDIVHGWIVDPQDKETYRVVVENCKSYNGVVECIVRGNENMDQSDNNNKKNINDTNSINNNNNSNDSSRDDNIHDGLVASTFLDDTATQLTYYGIELLRDSIPKNKLCVLFRNNHFSTLFKHPITEQLYTLVTDSGYVSESNIVWETLNDIDQGTSVFVNSDFSQNTPVIDQEQENADLKYAIELSIKQHQQERMRTSQTTHSNTSSPSVRTDHTQSSSTKIAQKKKSCIIS